jgi:hypothetical protein
LSERFVGKDFFNGLATPLNHSFALNQRRYIFYLLSLMNREWMRKYRRSNAMGTVMRRTLEQSPRERPRVIGELPH